jgi:hypothetical protein
MRKRVLLIVVDGCTSRLLGPAIDRGEMPLLGQLASRGSLELGCVSIFPSITPAATASIVTGRYPARHGIAGMSWIDPSTHRITYFGDDVRTVLKRGLKDFLHGFLLRLNGEWLQAPTLFELVERHGGRAACFNHLIFRGDVPHELSQPLLFKLLPWVPGRVTVHGPSWLCLGDFVATTPMGDGEDRPGGVRHRFGMDDEGTAGFLRRIRRARELPDFSVAYFADYDFESHDRGPAAALDTLARFDELLSDVFTGWGGVDRVLEEACIVLTADHAHSEVGDGDGAAVPLEDVLGGYTCADPDTGWREGADLVVCPNMRSAEVYVRRRDSDFVMGVCRALLEEPRVDHVIFRHARGDRDDFHVATRDRGSLRFRQTDAPDAVRDEYGAGWEMTGDLTAIDAAIEGGRLRYGVYPNALERVANVDARPGRIWVTARIGCEFGMPGQGVHHGAGSHGTLHELDSLVPLLVAGAPSDDALARTPRIVDVAPLCARFLDLPFEFQPGDSRA